MVSVISKTWNSVAKIPYLERTAHLNNQLKLIDHDVSHGDAHVLVIITESQRSAAQELITNWRENCQIKTCQIYIRYAIHVSETVSYDPYEDDVSDTMILIRDVDMLSSILFVQDYIEKYASNRDIIVVLMGNTLKLLSYLS
jgi:hypothetical protein